MDVFMRSVGFTRIGFFENVANIKKEIAETPDKKVVLGYGTEGLFVELYKMYGNGIGILARGIMDDYENITIESCEAFAVAETDLAVNKYVVELANNQPLIVFEDVGTGNELVFALQNRIDYIKDEQRFINHGRSVLYSKDLGIVKRKVNYVAFSVYGSIILPVHKPSGGSFEDTEEVYEAAPKSGSGTGIQNPFIRLAQNDEEALELLQSYADEVMKDIGDRLEDEDLLSVIEGFFLPMGEKETDYSVLGEIEAIEQLTNERTKEKILRLSLNITGSKMQLLINNRDLVGHPIPGMRFMGTCRLRGTVLI